MGIAQEYAWVGVVILVLFVVISSGAILNVFNSNFPTFGLATDVKNVPPGTLVPTTKGAVIQGAILAILLIIIQKIMKMK